jgi:SAM-dependent methyltransferase
VQRRSAYATDTQHIVNLSGYVWAATQVGNLSRMVVLDLACGTGYGSDYLRRLARHVVGVDTASDVIARCRAVYPGPRVSFVPMDGCRLGFRDESFDAVVSQDTLEHVVDDRRFVAELARVLRRDGILVLLTPQGAGGDHAPADPYHVREYAPDALHALIAPHFSSLRWFGRTPGARLRAVESHMDALRRWDPAGVRRVVPRRIRHWLGSLVSLTRGGAALEQIGPHDVEYREGHRDDSNLILVCRK